MFCEGLGCEDWRPRLVVHDEHEGADGEGLKETYLGRPAPLTLSESLHDEVAERQTDPDNYGGFVHGLVLLKVLDYHDFDIFNDSILHQPCQAQQKIGISAVS